MTLPTVLVVDDSGLIRSAIRDVLDATGQYRIVGEAATGLEAISLSKALRPDIISLDIEMPGIDGLQVLRWVMATDPTKIILVSSHTATGADVTLEGLSLGAVDFVPKASLGESFEAFAMRLRSTFEATSKAQMSWHARPSPVSTAPQELREPRLIVVAASTGGPEALNRFLKPLPAKLPIPMLIVQHMPATFTHRLASRLDTIGHTTVTEAADGSPLIPGTALVAAGGRHMLVSSPTGVTLDDGRPIGGLKPRADLTFQSAAEHYGDGVLGVVLTGMGNDGLAGSQAVVAAGGQVIAQDSESSVVDGMPLRVRQADLALGHSDPNRLASWIASTFSRSTVGSVT